MPLIGTELVPNAEEEKILRELILGWDCYRAATENMRKIAERSTKVLFPLLGRTELKTAFTTLEGIRYRIEKDGQVTKVQRV